ncbi:NupC/NupG family nucleoside CNT transporter [Halobacillus karajensis]|uniref:NupC/NupG family nucleoside CNT transporter n=1 Tax=Halobacillus karajensis TaxID=195088 RepID=UPI00045C3C19|nr:nucleoside transporter C-terminal domain-containing protein [Halobacillus karajensis]CDQ21741.1 Nucleoside-transport system protein NupC [Halobacillus karajensis]
MDLLIGIIGVLALLVVSFLMSNDKVNVRYKAVGIMVGLQLAITYFMLNTEIGLKIVETVASGFGAVIGYGMAGVSFVVGDISENPSVFFVGVLMLIIFTSALLSVLTHLRILPIAIKYVGAGLSKITGLPKVESFNAVNSIFFGQSESILAVKNHLPKLTKNRLFIVSTSAMASVSASIVGVYMEMLEPKYVLVAMILNMFSALIIASIVAPVKTEEEDEDVSVKELIQTDNIFDAIAQGAMDGGKVALIVASMLVAYLGLIEMADSILTLLVGTDLTTILGYILAPVAFIMGVPAGEIVQAGSVMGTKVLANEFVAITMFTPMIETLSVKTVGIVSTFLISFSAFGSIGIIAGSVQAVNGEKAKEVSKFGLKMLLIATMASALSATIVGLFI